MKRKLRAVLIIPFVIIILFACQDKTRSAEILEEQYLEIISDSEVSFEDFMDTVLFFETDETVYRMDLKLTELTYPTMRHIGYHFAFHANNTYNQIIITMEDIASFQENEKNSPPIITDTYNNFLIHVNETSMNLIYFLPDSGSYINMSWKPTRSNANQSDYEEIHKQIVKEWLDVITISEISQDSPEQIIQTVSGEESSSTLLYLSAYTNGSTFVLDSGFSLDLSKMLLGVMGRRIEDNYIRFSPLDDSLNIDLYFVPHNLYDTEKLHLSGLNYTLTELKEMDEINREFTTNLQVKNIDFTVYYNRFYNHILIYEHPDFSYLFIFMRNDKSVPLEEITEIFEKLIE